MPLNLDSRPDAEEHREEEENPIVAELREVGPHKPHVAAERRPHAYPYEYPAREANGKPFPLVRHPDFEVPAEVTSQERADDQHQDHEHARVEYRESIVIPRGVQCEIDAEGHQD